MSDREILCANVNDGLLEDEEDFDLEVGLEESCCSSSSSEVEVVDRGLRGVEESVSSCRKDCRSDESVR